MIANIDRGENLIGALSYNQLKVDNEHAEILCTHNMIEPFDGHYTVRQLMRSFEPYLIANRKTEKPVLHISLNPDPKEYVSDEKLESIAHDYMEQMGYGNQPYAVFKHTDIDRSHIHIVSVCIDEEGKKISDTFEKRKSVNISRALEEKYGLLPMQEKNSKKADLIFKPVDYKKENLKSQIASVVRYVTTYYKFQSIGEYNALLSLFNITSQEVKGELHGEMRQGMIYFALNENAEKVSHPFKASLFGKGAGHLKLEEHMTTSKEALKNDPVKTSLKRSIELAFHKTKDEISFKKQLLGKGINTVVRKNADNRIYGITFIDHISKTVWKGSRLGKDFSASVFNDWWHNNKKPQTKIRSDKKTTNPQTSQRTAIEENPHNLFDFVSKDNPDFIEGLGGLLLPNFGDDLEEQMFENQIKRKKKKRKQSG